MRQYFIVYRFVSERKRQVVIEQTQFLRTKEAWLILQSGIYIRYIFYQYFGRHGLPSSGSSMILHIMKRFKLRLYNLKYFKS